MAVDGHLLASRHETLVTFVADMSVRKVNDVPVFLLDLIHLGFVTRVRINDGAAL